MESEVRNRKQNRKSTKMLLTSTSSESESGRNNPEECLSTQQNERLVHEKLLSDEPSSTKTTTEAPLKSNGIKTENTNGIKSLQKSINNVKKQLQNGKLHCENKNQLNLIDSCERDTFKIAIEFDLMAIALFFIAFGTRIYRLAEPNNIVFDELHYGKYVSMYMKQTFFFDQHPPLGKQIIAAVASFVGYTGNYTFSRIGSTYTENVPVFWLRFVPALCGSLLAPCAYKLLLQMKLNRWIATLGGLLIIFDNALLTQSRFILVESMLLTFSLSGLLFLLKFQESHTYGFAWIVNGILAATFFALAFCVKFVGFYTGCLCFLTSCRYLWKLLPNKSITNAQLWLEAIVRCLIFSIIPIVIYILVFYVHLNVLHKAGPHDSIMTSAFQASLEGGLASITKGQPLKVVHGSQITLRHTLGRTCWLHSHTHVYPVRYPDKRGSSHQQQVTCYSFKDVNNWWIVKRPAALDLVVGEQPDAIRHGDEIQLIHGITSRALNSHDVAAAMTPQCQEVSCYIDYNVSMPGQILWRVDIINRVQEGDIWHAIKSQVRLIHSSTGLALRFTGRQLPEWGFNQHEVVADRVIEQPDTIWNVEEHRYTKTEDQKERERQLLNAEMIPTGPTLLSFWEKFLELQMKMIWHTDQIQSHMYGSEPLEWPLMSKGIAYWVDKDSNAQIHLLGNIVIWYTGTFAIAVYCLMFVFYLLRHRRQCYDLSLGDWEQFQFAGEIFLIGYLIHFVPYFLLERTLFLHNYMPALLYKILLLCFVIEHIDIILTRILRARNWTIIYRVAVFIWLLFVFVIFCKFSVLSYGMTKLTASDVIALRWKDTWDFILHKEFA